MKHIQKTNDGPVTLKKLLHLHNGGMELARDPNHIHASDLTNEKHQYCPRERYIMVKYGLSWPDRMVNTVMRITFDMGHYTQALFNNRWLRDKHYGYWRCVACRDTQIGFGNKWKHCECGGEYQYQEMQFVHKDMDRLTGSTDSLVLLVDGEKLTMVEVKIMDKDEFKGLVAPLSEHTTRTRFYLWLMENSTNPAREFTDLKRAKILYIMRGYGQKDEKGLMSPFKEFDIERDDAQIQHLIEAAMATTVGINTGVPPKGVCSTMTCTRATHCPVRKECFSGEF